jgi:hypothetical protein
MRRAATCQTFCGSLGKRPDPVFHAINSIRHERRHTRRLRARFDAADAARRELPRASLRRTSNIVSNRNAAEVVK